jgi:hypothetical protein
MLEITYMGALAQSLLPKVASTEFHVSKNLIALFVLTLSLVVGGPARAATPATGAIPSPERVTVDAETDSSTPGLGSNEVVTLERPSRRPILKRTLLFAGVAVGNGVAQYLWHVRDVPGGELAYAGALISYAVLPALVLTTYAKGRPRTAALSGVLMGTIISIPLAVLTIAASVDDDSMGQWVFGTAAVMAPALGGLAVGWMGEERRDRVAVTPVFAPDSAGKASVGMGLSGRF